MDLPKHPLEREMPCPICAVKFRSIPIRRAASPDDQSVVVEQHVCPTGHVYVTEIGKDQMLSEW